MMAHSGAGRTLATTSGYSIKGRDRGPGSLYGDGGYLDHRRRIRKKGDCEQNIAQPAQPTKTIVAEQWICLIFGFVCITFGIWGICMKPGLEAVSEYIAWLGSLYVPTLRVTAAVCFGLGVALVRWGWAHL